MHSRFDKFERTMGSVDGRLENLERTVETRLQGLESAVRDLSDEVKRSQGSASVDGRQLSAVVCRNLLSVEPGSMRMKKQICSRVVVCNASLMLLLFHHG